RSSEGGPLPDFAPERVQSPILRTDDFGPVRPLFCNCAQREKEFAQCLMCSRVSRGRCPTKTASSTLRRRAVPGTQAAFGKVGLSSCRRVGARRSGRLARRLSRIGSTRNTGRRG